MARKKLFTTMWQRLPTSMRALFMGLVVASCCVFAPAVRAEAPSPERQAEARELFEQGLALARSGKLVEAVDAFERSRAILERPSVLQNLAVALEGLGRVSEALADAQRALALRGPEHASAPELEAMCTRLSRQLARLTVRVEPGDASLWLDDRPLSSSAESVSLDPGSHTVRAEKRGYESVVRTLAIPAGGSHTEQLVLVRSEPATELVRSQPAEAVAKTLSAPVTPVARKSFALAPWGWASLGVAAASAVAGTSVYFSNTGYRNRWHARCSHEPCLPSTVQNVTDKIALLDRTAYALYGVSGVFLITAGALGWLARGEARSNTTLVIGPRSLSVQGRF